MLRSMLYCGSCLLDRKGQGQPGETCTHKFHHFSHDTQAPNACLSALNLYISSAQVESQMHCSRIVFNIHRANMLSIRTSMIS